MHFSKIITLIIVSLFSILSTSAMASCRYHSTCLKQAPTCAESHWSFDNTYVYKAYTLEAIAKEIFICRDGNGNIYENIFVKDLSKNINEKAEHYNQSIPRDTNEIDEEIVYSVQEAAQGSCHTEAASYLAQYPICKF